MLPYSLLDSVICAWKVLEVMDFSTCPLPPEVSDRLMTNVTGVPWTKYRESAMKRWELGNITSLLH